MSVDSPGWAVGSLIEAKSLQRALAYIRVKSSRLGRAIKIQRGTWGGGHAKRQGRKHEFLVINESFGQTRWQRSHGFGNRLRRASLPASGNLAIRLLMTLYEVSRAKQRGTVHTALLRVATDATHTPFPRTEHKTEARAKPTQCTTWRKQKAPLSHVDNPIKTLTCYFSDIEKENV